MSRLFASCEVALDMFADSITTTAKNKAAILGHRQSFAVTVSTKPSPSYMKILADSVEPSQSVCRRDRTLSHSSQHHFRTIGPCSRFGYSQR
jgi:hypothetical protein